MLDVQPLTAPLIGLSACPPPAFGCNSTNDDANTARVHVTGELDIATTPHLDRALRASQANVVVLDLRDVSFMDCSGVRVIADAIIRARESVRRLVVLRGPPEVDRVFTLTGCADLVDEDQAA